MQYDWIILGATFTAAGMVSVLGTRALILDGRPQAGYEFMNAMEPGGVPAEPTTAQAKLLLQTFREKGVYDTKTPCLFPAASAFYELLRNQDVLLGVTPVSVERDAEGFRVTAHGVSGFREFHARRVVDTRVRPWQVAAKALKLLVSSYDHGEEATPYGPDGDLLVTCPLSPDADWAEARSEAAKWLEGLPCGTKLIYTADEFTYTLKAAPTPEDGVDYLPSAGFSNPVEAFDGGALWAKEARE